MKRLTVSLVNIFLMAAVGMAAQKTDTTTDKPLIEMIQEAEGSIPLDTRDPAYAPGMGTPESGGMTIRELFPILRGLAAQNEVVGVDLVELNPLTDPTYHSRLVAVRTLREVLTGIAMRKKGITDPYYFDKKWTDHAVPMAGK